MQFSCGCHINCQLAFFENCLMCIFGLGLLSMWVVDVLVLFVLRLILDIVRPLGIFGSGGDHFWQGWCK